MDDLRARTLLTDQLRQLDEDTATELTDRTPAGGDPGLVSDTSDIGDQASDVSARMDRDLTVGTLRRRREHVLSALRRLDVGTFGACHVCGRTIDDERLEARPETEFCRDHAAGPGDLGPVEP